MKLCDAHELFVNKFFNHKNSIYSILIDNDKIKVFAKRKECLDILPSSFEGFEVVKILK